MRNKLIKEIRRSARALFPESPTVEYEEKVARVAPRNRIRLINDVPTQYKPTVRHLSNFCIKGLVQQTKRQMQYAR